MSKSNLSAYRGKRRFDKTPEPDGARRRNASDEAPLFVIQKHAASTLHYDLRLEVDGVLKSWAAPKGPSTDPREKSLAVQTEDHPLDYAEFEGVIPQGEYGAGTVMVWDKGVYKNITESNGDTVRPEQALKDGHFSFRLDGEKLRGGYSLTRFRKGGEDAWLLVKMDDDDADARRNPVSTEPLSVLSGRTLDQISADAAG